MDLCLTTLKAVSFCFAAQYFNIESMQNVFRVSQLCVNTFPAIKVTLLQMGFNSVA
jgi:hypothetical protein